MNLRKGSSSARYRIRLGYVEIEQLKEEFLNPQATYYAFQ